MLPDIFGGTGGTRAHELAALAGALVGSVGAYLTAVCPIAAYALGGRWSFWSLVATSLVFGVLMLGLAVSSYCHAREPPGGPEQVSKNIYGAMLGLGLLVLYLLFATSTLVWIASQRSSRDHPSRL